MATKAVTVVVQNHRRDVAASSFTYAALANGDDGTPIQKGLEWDEMSAQVKGTLGAGGTIVIEGSNDGGTTWATLSDGAGVALSLTALGIKRIAERCDQYRPRVTGGDGTTALVVVIVARRAGAGR